VPPELLLVQVSEHAIQAVPAVACVQVLPRQPGPVLEGLRDAVQQGRPVPVARVRGQAGQTEAGGGELGVVPATAANPQGSGTPDRDVAVDVAG
jgi:hypothetical protein